MTINMTRNVCYYCDEEIDIDVVHVCMKTLHDKIEALEAKLKIAKEALEEVVKAVDDPTSECYECIAGEALSKLNEEEK